MREYSFGTALDLDPVLPPEHVSRVTASGTRRRFARNEAFYRQGEPATHVFLLLSGRVKTALVNSAGQEAVLRIHLPGSLLGLTVLTSARRRDASAVAIEPAEAAMVGREAFLALLRQDAELGVSLMQLLLDRMSDFHFRVGELQANSVEQRLARALLSLARPDPVAAPKDRPLGVALTHEELAHLINTRRQTVTAILSRFAEAGLITKEGRRILIADPRSLAALLPA
jgi:CRP-like cAMP-binding protein